MANHSFISRSHSANRRFLLWGTATEWKDQERGAGESFDVHWEGASIDDQEAHCFPSALAVHQSGELGPRLSL